MANARTAVVVKKSPTAAVAVNSEKFIWRTFLKRLIISLDWSCIKKYFYTKFIFVLPEYHYVKKKASQLWGRVMGNLIFNPI